MFVRRAASRILAALRGWWRRGFPLPPFVVVEGAGVVPFVRVTCPRCRDVDIPFVDVRIIEYASGAEWIGYVCPVCKRDGMTPLPSAYSAQAHGAGFPVVKMPDPIQIDAAPLTEDDLIAFGLALHRTEEIPLA